MEPIVLPDPADQKPLWTQDEAIAFEVARETISHLLSICTSEIADEERKAKPDKVLIGRLEARFTALHQERARLRLTDHAEVARISQEYGALVHAWNRRQDTLAAE
ncbi:MAG TPA: hypothetical protein VL418_18140 [Devosiaceae bacterium]|jgi:hypothetical protein|nr:hypothetical protein [Devosiaceae bacterium]